MKIYNTLTSKKETLEPRKNKKVQMFVCGPTVYDYIHIGNARTFVVFDVVAKYLRYRGYDVNYIQNITDIDNKIIERAQKEKADPLEYAKKYSDIFKQDMESLGVTSPEYKNATDYIPEVIKQVQTLLDKGSAYLIENDPDASVGAGGIYFDLSTFPDYGKLSGRTALMTDDAVSRIDDSDKKRNRGDFALWKFSKPGEPGWEAKFEKEGQTKGRQKAKSALGRPGWHIEDTAITEKYFGPQYDIHGGGQDLIFPHHEAEIAQQESASGLKPFVKYWMHSGFLINKNAKMSKSAGNFETLRDVLKKYSPKVLRYYFLSAHYRSPLDFSEDSLNTAKTNVDTIRRFRNRMALIKNIEHKENEMDIKVITSKTKEDIEVALDDDFNTPKAIGIYFDFIREMDILFDTKKLGVSSLGKILSVFNIGDTLGITPTDTNYDWPQKIQTLIDERERARQNKDWEKADELREKLKSMGYPIDDTPYGPSLSPSPEPESE
ncbi:MAG: cysteine--tRNA ligase [Patescibacteria group bacterium]